MSLTNITNTTTIYRTGALTSSTGYLDLRQVVTQTVLKNDYGYQGAAAHVVVSGENIKAEEWNSLITDIDVVWRHQQDQSFTVEKIPRAGDEIGEFFVNQLINATNDLVSRKYNRPPPGQRSTSAFSSAAGSGTSVVIWPQNLTHTVEMEWNKGMNPTQFVQSDLLTYFNLGGRISFNLSCNLASTSTDNLLWKNRIDNFQSGISSFVFDRQSLESLNSSNGFKTASTSSDGNIILSVEAVTTNNLPLSGNTPRSKWTKLIASVELTNSLTGVDLTTTSTITAEYSTNAIFAPVPFFSVTENFGDNYVPVVVYKESILIPPPNSFEMRARSTSTAQTIRIINNGNTATTIKSYGVSVSGVPDIGITPIVDYNWDITQPKVIQKDNEVSFNLRYYYQESVNTTLYGTGEIVVNTVESPFTSLNAYTRNTQQIVNPELFSFTLSPAFISYSTSSSAVLEQKFNIVPRGGTYTISATCTGSSATSVLYVDSTASINVSDVVYGLSNMTTSTDPVIQSIGEKTLTINNTLSSTITNAQSIIITRPIVFNLPTQEGYRIIQRDYTGPTVQFSTGTNGTFTTAISVIATGVNSQNSSTTYTTTASISITRNAPTTENIGTWTSALQPFNGVVGASYDLIDGKRYVTIGFGMGADGSTSLANDPTGTGRNVDNLGINSTVTGIIVDSKYALDNPPLYAGNNDSAYTPFLKSTINVGGYGVWIRPSNYLESEGGRYGPYNIYVNRTYKFITTTAGSHTWTMASDNESYFTIDGGSVGDLRNVGRDQSYKREYTGSVHLEAGEHTLTFYVINTNGPAAIALRVLDPTSQEVWSTRFPIRIGPVYQNWQEVYRIPLTGAAQSYQCNDAYCIKNSNNVNGQRWGYYFGSAGTTANSMFTVADDGSGNITIDMNGVNVNSSDMTTLNSVDPNAYSTIANAPHLFYYYSYLRESIGYRQYTTSTTLASDGTTQYFLGFTRDGAVRTSSVIPPTDPTNTIVTPSNPGINNNDLIYENQLQ